MTFYELEKEIEPVEWKQRLDKTTLAVIQDQNVTGIDFITDGEERRGHYILGILKKHDGIDFENLKQKSIREGKYVRSLPVVVAKIAYKGPTWSTSTI